MGAGAAVKRFFGKKLSLIATIVLVLLFGLAFIGPLILPMDLNYSDPSQINLPPNMSLKSVSGDIKNDIKYIDNAKSIVLLYDPKDEIKKNKVKKFFDQYLKLKDKNIQVVPFRINENDKKDYLRINSLKESLC